MEPVQWSDLLARELHYLGNPHPFPEGCEWFEIDRVKQFCLPPVGTNDRPTQIPFTIVGRVSTNLNNTGIFGGWSANSKFSPQCARRTFQLGAPLSGPICQHWETAINNLKDIQGLATGESSNARYLFADGNQTPMNCLLRLGCPVFRDLAENECLDEQPARCIPASETNDSSWFQTVETKALVGFPVFGQEGCAIPLPSVKGSINDLLVKVTFMLRCWKFARNDPFSFAADVCRIDIIERQQQLSALHASLNLNAPFLGSTSDGIREFEDNSGHK
ncbi:hypothetical protein GYMLUDRAFT_55338 [Collybiopsis luxurians FD-317 M1]|nr:hypothetical protein GYMLUDRAFT_55338 [Collybiopsis luxurians FD-317 M1]